jgi:hypothetical protein
MIGVTMLFRQTRATHGPASSLFFKYLFSCIRFNFKFIHKMMQYFFY